MRVIKEYGLVDERSDFTAEVYGVAYSPDGKYLAVGNSGGIKVWEAGSIRGSEILTIPEDVSSVVFSPDGTRVLTASGDFEDPTLSGLKRQMQEQINGVLGMRGISEVTTPPGR